MKKNLKQHNIIVSQNICGRPHIYHEKNCIIINCYTKHLHEKNLINWLKTDQVA